MYNYIQELETKDDFANKLLNVELSQLDELKELKEKSIYLFTKHQIPKKQNPLKHRIVYKVNDDSVKNLYKKLNFKLFWFLKFKNIGFPHECSFGYTRGKGIADNAKQHCNKKLVMKIDIENFFNSITHSKITDKLHKLSKLNKDLCKEIASFCCINNILPLGLNTSPLISNIVCFDMDAEIHKYCIENNITYTRYVDDVSVSSDNDIISHKERIYKIITNHKFKPNEEKFRITKNGMAHFVTGLSVSDNKPHVPKKMKQMIRQKLYYIKKYGFYNHCYWTKKYRPTTEYNKIDGTIAFMKGVETNNFISEIDNKWLECKRIKNNELTALTFKFKKYIYSEINNKCKITDYFIGDESVLEFNDGSKYLFLCCVRLDKSVFNKVNTMIESFISKALKNPHINDRQRARIKEKGMHFVDMNEDIIIRFIDEILIYINFKSYISFKKIEKDYNDNDYKELLDKCLQKPLRKLGVVAEILLEENSKINKNIPLAKFQTKQDCRAIALPDFLLGVLCRYLKKSKENGNKDRYKMFYESLLPRYNSINSPSKVYCRKNPFYYNKFIDENNLKEDTLNKSTIK